MSTHQKLLIALSVAIMLCLTSVTAAWGADIRTVSGTVVDESGEPLIGVGVRELNTKNAVVTNIDGEFTIKLSSAKPVLDFSYVGYKSVQIPVTSAKINVKMESATTDLDEVVVVAYGQQKKVTVTGSVAAVSSKEIQKSSEPNLAAALSGKLPGLTTMQSSGAPGEDDVTMFLRGAATMNGTSPLILVDGIPRSSMSEIDPNEVQSISILKDASSTAVFGVRGANGVILITTRRGEEGKVNVHGQVTYSMQKFNYWPETRHSWDFANLVNEASASNGGNPIYSAEEVALYETWRDGTGPSDPNLRFWYPDTNWGDIYLKDHSNMVQANVNLSGGTKKLRYFASAGYVYQGGMYNTESKSFLGYDPQSKMNRYNIRTNLDYTFNSWLSASFDVSSNIKKTNQAASNMAGADTSHLRLSAVTSKATVPGPTTIAGDETNHFIVKDSGTQGWHYVNGNMLVQDKDQSLAQMAYGQLNRSGYRLLVEASANAIGTLNFNLDGITKGLSARAVISFETYANQLTQGSRQFSGYLYDLHPGGYEYPVFLMQGDSEDDDRLILTRGDTSNWFMNLQAQVNYNRSFNKVHNVTGMVLFQRDDRENILGSIPYKMLGLAGRFTYNYDSRYLAEVNVGYNGSEQFAPGHRFGLFPAFSLGWVISNEKFMERLRNSGTITNLKLRASVGKVGNDELYVGGEAARQNNRFLYLDNISKVNSYIGSGNAAGEEPLNIPFSLTSTGAGIGIIKESLLGNDDIHWETAWKQNYAIDLTLFRHLDLTFDYFIENRSDILISRNTIPQIGGLSSSQLPRSNFGKVDNHGYEITARYDFNVNRNIQLYLSGNFAYNNNKVINADEVRKGDDYAYPLRSEGFPLGQLWGYSIDYSVDPERGLDGTGFFNTKDQIKLRDIEYSFGTPACGDFVYKDLNNDGKVDEKDIAPIGYSGLLPRITYGLTLGGNLYGFDFSVMLQGVGKYSKYFGSSVMYENYGTYFFSDMCDNRWSEERYLAGENITHPRLSLQDTPSHTANDYYIMDASYIRLKNITLGYTVPKNLTKKMGLNGVRVYVSADNVHTWNNLRTKMIDPEQSGFTSYPLMKTYSAGVSIDI